MPRKKFLPEADIIKKWLLDIDTTSRSLAIEFKCSSVYISKILKKHLPTTQINTVMRQKISKSTAKRPDLKTETHRQNAIHASACRSQEGVQRFRESSRNGVIKSADIRRGNALSQKHREKLSQSHIGINAGPLNANWKGGTSKVCWRGPGWAKARREARTRDGNKCCVCGKTSAEQGRQMDVHHRISYFSFENSSDANNLDNLLCLCRSCHRKVESGTIECPKSQREGVPEQIVDPRNSSRECCECGYIDKRNRPTRDQFCCLRCGNRKPADWNAACVIAGRAIVNAPHVADGESIAHNLVASPRALAVGH